MRDDKVKGSRVGRAARITGAAAVVDYELPITRLGRDESQLFAGRFDHTTEVAA